MQSLPVASLSANVLTVYVVVAAARGANPTSETRIAPAASSAERRAREVVIAANAAPLVVEAGIHPGYCRSGRSATRKLRWSGTRSLLTHKPLKGHREGTDRGT